LSLETNWYFFVKFTSIIFVLAWLSFIKWESDHASNVAMYFSGVQGPHIGHAQVYLRPHDS
jgi:hypothetical protein